MGVIHFLNVGDGDCSIIEHSSGHVTMIDICNGNANANYSTDNIAMDKTVAFKESLCGNRNQKNYPVNPIEYLKSLSSEKMIFRFILTHPDMDHLDGIKNLFDEFKISNFWDTNNNKRMNESGFGGYKKEDWDFYQKIRRSKDDITVLNLYDGSKGKYYNCDDDGGKGDYLQVLCPTKELIRDINTAHSGYNNCSYVILYNECDKKILFCGDGEAKEWDALLEKHEDILTDIDVLIAPHHGRKSGGNDDFLKILNPKLTLFGNAKSKDLNYYDWINLGLRHLTNNQGGSFILEHCDGGIDVYCQYKPFAEAFIRENGRKKYKKDKKDAWYLLTIN